MRGTDDLFLQILTGFNFIDIEIYPNTIFGLYPDFTLAYFNPAWFVFAAANGGEPQISEKWSIGRSIFDAIPEDLSSFYMHLYKKALVTATISEHVYECSSSECLRKFHQIIYPVSGQALLVVNSLVISMPIEKNSCTHLFSEEEYRDADGIMHQCAHCRRIKNIKQDSRWDWIGYFVKYPPEHTVHSLCSQCRGYYYQLDGLPA
jgi:hypothetical protein